MFRSSNSCLQFVDLHSDSTNFPSCFVGHYFNRTSQERSHTLLGGRTPFRILPRATAGQEEIT